MLDPNCDCEGDILNSMLRSFDYDPDEEEGFHVKDLDPFMKLLCALNFAISSCVVCCASCIMGRE